MNSYAAIGKASGYDGDSAGRLTAGQLPDRDRNAHGVGARMDEIDMQIERMGHLIDSLERDSAMFRAPIPVNTDKGNSGGPSPEVPCSPIASRLVGVRDRLIALNAELSRLMVGLENGQ